MSYFDKKLHESILAAISVREQQPVGDYKGLKNILLTLIQGGLVRSGYIYLTHKVEFDIIDNGDGSTITINPFNFFTGLLLQGHICPEVATKDVIKYSVENGEYAWIDNTFIFIPNTPIKRLSFEGLLISGGDSKHFKDFKESMGDRDFLREYLNSPRPEEPLTEGQFHTVWTEAVGMHGYSNFFFQKLFNKMKEKGLLINKENK
jgi:hypothetical protein